MANPHITGVADAQIPTPSASSVATAHRNSSNKPKPTEKQAIQNSGVRL